MKDMKDMTEKTNDNVPIKELDELIFDFGKFLDIAELYTVVLGISIYRLQKIIGHKAVEDLLMYVLENLKNIPAANRNAMH